MAPLFNGRSAGKQKTTTTEKGLKSYFIKPSSFLVARFNEDSPLVEKMVNSYLLYGSHLWVCKRKCNMRRSFLRIPPWAKRRLTLEADLGARFLHSLCYGTIWSHGTKRRGFLLSQQEASTAQGRERSMRAATNWSWHHGIVFLSSLTVSISHCWSLLTGGLKFVMVESGNHILLTTVCPWVGSPTWLMSSVKPFLFGIFIKLLFILPLMKEFKGVNLVWAEGLCLSYLNTAVLIVEPSCASMIGNNFHWPFWTLTVKIPFYTRWLQGLLPISKLYLDCGRRASWVWN